MVVVDTASCTKLVTVQFVTGSLAWPGPLTFWKNQALPRCITFVIITCFICAFWVQPCLQPLSARLHLSQAQLGLFKLLLRPGSRAEYCDQFVCLCVCVCLSVRLREYLWNHWTDHHKIFVQIPRGRGSVLLWRHCDTLCTSGFMDDVTFGRSGPCGDAWLAAL